jgi:hypothetical protein
MCNCQSFFQALPIEGAIAIFIGCLIILIYGIIIAPLLDRDNNSGTTTIPPDGDG